MATFQYLKKVSGGTATAIYPYTEDTVKTAQIVNDLSTADASKVLSAKMGYEIDQRLKKIAAIGRFLSNWNCQTGLPVSAPGTVPYGYKTGDYYRVEGVVPPEDPKPTYYKPTGLFYDGSASTVEETATSYANGMIYYFDGSSWLLDASRPSYVMFSSIIGDPLLNPELKDVFDTKLTHLGPEAGSGQPYHFPFNVTGITQEASAIKVDFDTLTLDGNNTVTPYNFSLPLADPANDKAGLWNKGLSDFVDVECVVDMGTGTVTGSVTSEQFAKIMTGKAVRCTVREDSSTGTIHAIVTGTPYCDTKNNKICLVALEIYSSGTRTMNVTYIDIDGTTLQMRADMGAVGHELTTQMTATGGDKIMGITIDGTGYDFDIDKTGLATEEQLGDGTVSMLGTSDIGSATQPIYWNGGVPAACTYQLNDAGELSKITSTDTATTADDDHVYTALKTNALLAVKSAVSVSATGTATDEVQYITVDGTEHKLPTGGTTSAAWGSITGTLSAQTDLQNALDAKSTVGVKASGTSVDDVSYIVINGTEYRLSGIVGVKMNGGLATVTNKIADLGTVITDVSGKVDKNLDITAGTACKITYDAKGLVTAGAALAESDIPNLASSKVNLMTGYAVATSKGAIATTDTLNQAVGKLEKALDGFTDGTVSKVGTVNVGTADTPIYLNAGVPTAGTKVISNVLDGYAIATTASALAATDTIIQALAKLEYRLKVLEDAPLVRYGDVPTP